MASTGKGPPTPATDSGFFEQLTLGLSKVLNNTPRVCNVSFEKRQPSERSQITTWEQRHNVYLPEDMKRFYLSTDGFSFSWSYQYSPSDVRRVGYFNIPNLLQITLLRENLESIQGTGQSPGSNPLSGPSSGSRFEGQSHCPLPNITARTKIFDMNTIPDLGKVCLVYESLDLCNLKVYLFETRAMKLTFLADSFSEYLRMTIVHLGLPYWELCFSSCGLPPWTEQLFLLLAPHLLERSEQRRSKVYNPHLDSAAQGSPVNILDTAVFRSKTKGNGNHSSNNNNTAKRS